MAADKDPDARTVAEQASNLAALCPQAVFSTDPFPERERFDAWRSLIGLTHELSTQEADFAARLRSTQLGEMLVHVMDASSQAVHRAPERVRRDGLDHFVLHLSTHAQGATEGDRELFIPAGAVSINDVSRPHRRLAAPERGSLIVSLPRDFVSQAVANTDALHGQVLHHGMGGLLRDHIVALASHAGRVTRAAAPDLSLATVRMLAACVNPSSDNLEQARPSLDAALVVRAKRYIEAHLGSPNLTPAALCRALHVSRATLFRAFQPLDGVAAYIGRRRLEAVRRALLTGSPDPIATIGHRYGFTNGTHLSRGFRRQFGMSPTEFRANRERDHLTAVARPPSTGRLFSDWVQRHG
ncbi:helix-turn-helix domain-containing protein [Methylobacterium radiodurans]|uniref:AraC family transcriptional regulator n=1 Tax=Methylobacterium radiodurans TaxID=2202828 RepID=A0A2U8VZ89_9HYPH|nr:helix-turn-helix domain-containing protein [Methylobacterium radiodurans]AWN38560.1 AraC family transcriptional regulator [Methylobacterium radiodurans]